MESCLHTRYFDSSYHTKICEECGIEVMGNLHSEATYTENMPLFHGYSRLKRFRTMLMSILDPLRNCSMDPETEVALYQETFGNTVSLLKRLKQIKSRNKQYSSVHLYAKKYVRDHKSPPTPLAVISNELLADFTLLEIGHQKHFENEQFFSYRWVLEKLLIKHGLTVFLKYVKKLQNKRSIANYERMYKKIMNGCSVAAIPDMVSKSGRQLVGPPGGDLVSSYSWSLLLNSAAHARPS